MWTSPARAPTSPSTSTVGSPNDASCACGSSWSNPAVSRARSDRSGADGSLLRVLCLHTATLPPLGADTWVHAEIIGTLDRTTHDVHVAYAFTRDGQPTPTAIALAPASDITRIDVNLGRERSARTTTRIRDDARDASAALASMVRLLRYIRRHRIDVVYTSDRPRDALASVVLARLTRARSVVHIHVQYSTWMGRVLRRAIRDADARIAVSQFVADSVTSGGVAGPTYVARNAIDPERWTPGDGRQDVRHELGIAESALVVITVCRLFEEKGVARLIRAFAASRDAVADARLLVVGHDPSGGEYLAHLQDLADERGVGDAVTFTGRRPDVARLMAASDIFAMPSFEEPFGLVYAEAMAMQLPVVALDNGGTKEVVEHGTQGLLSAPGDEVGLAGHLRTLLTEPELRARMGLAGRRHVEQHFRIERMASDAAAALRLVASRTHT